MKKVWIGIVIVLIIIVAGIVFGVINRNALKDVSAVDDAWTGDITEETKATGSTSATDIWTDDITEETKATDSTSVTDIWTGDITEETKAEFIDRFMGEGASDEEPFFVFYGTEDYYQNAEGELQLELYYDEATGNGCGIRYVHSQSGENDTLVEMKGFAFVAAGAMSDNQNAYDFTSVEDIFSVTYYDGSDGSNVVEDYEESYEYNDAGQIIHYESTGRIDWLSDADENQMVIEVDFTYREDGTLCRKESHYNTYIFGTTKSSCVTYFDEQQRAIYERAYITHGSLDYYYIYNSDAAVPDYELMLDDNLGDWWPSFAKYE